MKNVTIEATPRDKNGKEDARRLRRDGRVPCVLYGGDEVRHFSLEQKHVHKFVFSPSVHRIQVKLDGQQYDTIIQDIQYNPVTDEVIHLDMLQMFEDKPVKVRIPVVTHGIPIGVKEGGRLRIAIKKILVKALPNEIPDAIEVNIEDMQVGDYLRVGDLPYPSLEFDKGPETVVVAVKALRSLEEIVLTPTAELEGEEGEEGEAAEGGEAAAEGEEGAEASAEGGEEGGEEKGEG